MREKKWTDCPSCGLEESMVFKKGIKETYEIKDYGKLKLDELEGYVCKSCKETIFTRKSENKINSAVAEFRAKKDAKNFRAVELTTVDELAKKRNKTRQRIHQMMREGKIRYVFIENLRFPLKSELSHK